MSHEQRRLISQTKGGWTDADIARLQDLYPTAFLCDLLAAFPTRSKQSIYVFAYKLGLSRPPSGRERAGARNVNYKDGLPYKDKRTYAMRLAQNPDRLRATMRRHVQKRRAMMIGSVRGVSYDAILARDGYVCWLCKLSVERADLSFDHVIPLSKGGPHSLDNIRVSHWKCNYPKRAKIIPAE
jgi:5-methylcytosine-specific restriction endonuclease McrA